MNADPLVGRDPALATLAGAVRAAADHRPSVLLVAGEPGIGKTALLSESARRAAADGARVLWGQCWEGDGAPAYWPWIQVVRAAVQGQPLPDIPGLTRLLDPAEPDDGLAGSPSTARFGLFDGVLRLLARLADEGPVVLMLDDLQWADEASLALLEFAARHLHHSPVLLLGAYRDLDAPAGLRRLAGLAETLPLARLDRDGVAAVMAQVTGSTPTGELAAEVLERSGGNPLFVRELTRLLLAQGGMPVAGGSPPVLLNSVRETLQRRLARLSEACIGMLSAAAAAGPRIRPAVLRRLISSPDDLADLLAEAVTAGVLVTPSDQIDMYQFSHDLYRESLYVWLAPAERTRLHAACGHALATLADAGVTVHAAEIATHFVAASAGNAGNADLAAPAVDWSRRAAREAMARLAAEDARHHYQRGLLALDTAAVGGEADRVDLLLGLADAHNRAGDASAARATYQQAARLARQLPDPNVLAAAAIGLHSLGAPSGLSHAEPITVLREAALALSGTDSPQLALVLASMARDLYHSWEDDHLGCATDLAEQAVDLARRHGDPALLASCLLALHDTRWLPGSAPQRLTILDEILDFAAAGNRQLHTQALLLRAAARLELGDPRGHQDLTEHWHTVEQSGHARGRWQALSRRATTALIAGDMTSARTFSHQAAQLGQRIGEPDWSNVADGQLWEILRFTNERSRYASLAHNTDTVAGWPPWRALGLADAGHLDEARALLAGFDVDRGFRPGARTSPEPVSMAIVAEAVAAAGTQQQREEMYQRLTPLAGLHAISGGCAAYSGAFDHYLGLLAASLGRNARAHAHFSAAAAMHQRLGAAAWLTLSHAQLDRLAATGASHDPTRPILQPDGDTWKLSYAGREVHLPDLKGLHDLATLIANPGRPIHVVQLLTGQPPAVMPGADPILDDQAKAVYRTRLAQLDAELDNADEHGDRRRAERARLEREALLHELAAAAGLGGRDRRLGDGAERARKTITSRIRDTVTRIQRHHPDLARHLDESITTGTWCSYTATEPTTSPPVPVAIRSPAESLR